MQEIMSNNTQPLIEEKSSNKSSKFSIFNLLKIFLFFFLCALLIIILTVYFSNKKNNGHNNNKNYKIWCVGNCNSDITTQSLPGTIFVGGGVKKLFSLISLVFDCYSMFD